MNTQDTRPLPHQSSQPQASTTLRHALFITWDGPQVTYLESLFLPILAGLAHHGWAFHVLQFTWGEQARIDAVQQRCAQAGIPYRAVRILRRPKALGALLTAITGLVAVRQQLRCWHINLILARSTLPALSALLALPGHRCPLVFDADGLPLDERVEFAGQSPTSLSQRVLRWVEVQAVRRAVAVLVRTAFAAQVLQSRAGAGTPTARFHVVGNGRDASVFQPCTNSEARAWRRQHLLPENALLLVYAGSMGKQYCLPEMLTLFESVAGLRRRGTGAAPAWFFHAGGGAGQTGRVPVVRITGHCKRWYW